MRFYGREDILVDLEGLWGKASLRSSLAEAAEVSPITVAHLPH